MNGLKNLHKRLNNLDGSLPNVFKEELKNIKLSAVTMSKIFRCVNEVERRKLYNNSSPGGNFFYFRRLFLKYKNKLPTVKLDPEDEKLCKSMDRAKTPKDYKKIDNKIKLLKKTSNDLINYLVINGVNILTC